MKIIVTGKNITVSDKIQEAIDKKFEKFGKYFADDTRANIVMHPEKDKVKFTVWGALAIFILSFSSFIRFIFCVYSENQEKLILHNIKKLEFQKF